MYRVSKFKNICQEFSHITQFLSIATFYNLLQDNLLYFITQSSEKFKSFLRKCCPIDLVAKQRPRVGIHRYPHWSEILLLFRGHSGLLQTLLEGWGFSLCSMQGAPGCLCLWRPWDVWVRPKVKINRTFSTPQCSICGMFSAPFTLEVARSDCRWLYRGWGYRK